MGAKTVKGLALPREVSLSYRTPGLLTVAQVLPAPQAESVTPDSAVVVAFNQPVVPLGADSASQPAGFTLEPAASGRGEWLNTSTYIFYPDPGLAGGIDYNVRVNTSLKSSAGTPLDASAPNLAWAFRTALPEVLNISPRRGDQIDLDPQVEITFNQPMDTASVESAFTLRGPDGNAVPGTFSWNERGTVVTFTVSGGLLPRETAYTLTVGAASRSRGGAPLGQDIQSQFSTYRLFRFESANIPEGGVRSRSEGLVLYFGAPIQTPKGVELSELLRVSPAVSYLYAGAEGTQVSIYGDFAPGQTYTLTLPAALADKWGQTLGQDIQFTFREPDAQPSLEYGSYSQELFTRPAEPVLSARAVNVQTIIISRGTLTLDDFLRLDSDYNFRQTFVPPDNETWTLRPDLPRTLNQPVEFNLSEGSLAPGLYLVQVDSPDISYRYRNTRLLVSSDINVTVKASATEVLAWAMDLRTQQPVSFTTVRVYDEKGGRIANGETDAEGLWRGAIPSGSSARMVVVGKPGDEQFGVGSPNWSLGVSAWDFDLSFDPSGPRTIAYLYTERPVYRPGDVVSLRGILRSRYDGRYSASGISSMVLRLSDPNGPIEERNEPVSEYGTFNGQFSLPENAVPGGYTISIDLGENQWVDGGSIYFKVADYRKPEIYLSAQMQPNPASSGQALTGLVSAEYFFGAPAADLPFKWSLYSQRDTFAIPSFNTGIYSSDWLALGERFGAASQSGEGRTDANGRFVIALEDIKVNDTSELTLEVTATESGGFPVSARATLTVHPDSFYIGVRPQVWFGQAGSPMNFDLLTVDWEQNPVSRVVQAEFKKVRWEREDIGFGYRFTPVYTPVESKSITTGADGRGEVAFTPAESGTYALEVTSGNAKTQLLLWVGGAQNAAWPNLPYDQLRLTADQAEYQPGQTAEVFIPNPFEQPAQALLTTERGTFKTAQVVSIPAEGYRLRLPISEAEAPNIYVSATLLGLGTGFKQGYINLPVDPAALTLNVDLKATPEKAGPGDTLTIDLTVTDQKGQPMQGEFSMAVVDLAALALADPNSEDIIPAYYSIQPLGVRTGLTNAISTRRLLNLGVRYMNSLQQAAPFGFMPARSQLRVHLVGVFERQHLAVPDLGEAGGVHGRFADHAQAIFHLGGGADRLAVDVQGVAGEVAHHEIENLVEQGFIHGVDFGIFEDQLAVDDQGEDFAQGEQEIHILALGLVGSGKGQEFLESPELLPENPQVGQIETIEDRLVVVETDFPQAARRALLEEKIVVPGVVAPGHGGIFRRVEEVIGHEFNDQGDVDMHRALQFGQGADVAGRHLEESIALEALGGDHIPEQVDDLLALGGDFHLDDGVVEQVAPVVRGGGAEVVGGAQREQFHRHQAGVGVHEHLADVREVGDGHVVQAAVGGVADGFIKSVRADADGGPAQVVFADVDRVEARIPGLRAALQDFIGANGVIAQQELADVVLAGSDVFEQLVVFAAIIGHEEDIVAAIGHFAKSRDHRGQVGVADVIFLAVGPVAAIRLGRETHLSRVDVRPVRALREPKGEHGPLLEQLRGPALEAFVLAHPDRPQAQDGDLPGVPVGQPVKTQNLVEFAVAPGVPAAAGVAVARWGQQGGEKFLLPDKVEEIGVPGAGVIVFFDLFQALVFKKSNGFAHDLPRWLVGIVAVVLFGVQEKHFRLLNQPR